MGLSRILILFLVLVFSSEGSWAFPPSFPLSAIRDPKRSYLEYVEEARKTLNAPTFLWTTPESSAKPLFEADLPAVTAWENVGQMQARFQRIRDERWLRDSAHGNFLRRSTWLYPDDGCYARAALAVKNSMAWRYPSPKKIFVFGDLTVKTENSPMGSVSWWYHVAPIVEVGNEKYVLDPAIEPRRPLLLRDWLATMHDNPESLSIAICATGTYGPNDDCTKESNGGEHAAIEDQVTFLPLERSRLKQLGRDPEQELGDAPPWQHSSLPAW